MKLAGEALDAVRKNLRKQGADLTGGLSAIRGNEWTRSQEQLDLRRKLARTYPKLGRAIALREALQELWPMEICPPSAGGWAGPTAPGSNPSANFPELLKITFTAFWPTSKPA